MLSWFITGLVVKLFYCLILRNFKVKNKKKADKKKKLSIAHLPAENVWPVC